MSKYQFLFSSFYSRFLNKVIDEWCWCWRGYFWLLKTKKKLKRNNWKEKLNQCKLMPPLRLPFQVYQTNFYKGNKTVILSSNILVFTMCNNTRWHDVQAAILLFFFYLRKIEWIKHLVGITWQMKIIIINKKENN